jgi:hypothetical protein
MWIIFGALLRAWNDIALIVCVPGIFVEGFFLYYAARFLLGESLRIAASILASRKLSSESVSPGMSPREVAAIDDALTWAKRILDAIDRKFPVTH